jgi:hypothetical protein
MKLDRESRRTVAQFLNGLAVAVVGTLVLAPAAGGSLQAIAVVCGLVGAALLHALALALCK